MTKTTPEKRTLDPSLCLLAGERAGLFTTQEASAHGMTPTQLRLAVKLTLCRPVVRGVYSIGPPPGSREGRLAELTMAMLLICPTAAATGRSALALRGIPLFGVNHERAQGVWTNRSSQHATAHMVVRRPLVAPEVEEHDGWLLTSLAWNLVDLARDAGVEAGVVSMDAALHQGLVQTDDVLDIVDRLGTSHRLASVQRMVELSDPRSESAGESRLRLDLLEGGIEVEPQFEIRLASGQLFRSDFRVKGTKVLIEFDGLVKYAGADGRDVLAREKAREDALRAEGWVIVRVTWADLVHPRQLVARIKAAVAATLQVAG
ncbi:hypothetical protein FB554_2570 [Barrientosiimonas humi]|uniref:Very-short-patch-repair endonuclease n=1 Tax=Barrientosiimonas humi TaxID=999931 RepID=A0A542XF05_9MICO|nr:hypothetical protein [Barrientosiimonas humi]TQL34400.1 hypothetical protein FB554_2570 [Barrientosiimonas humi]CAG7574390.1 hypothetical protein BH39T_PBIAJDOK_03040 [Barrientosiimonas humi]